SQMQLGRSALQANDLPRVRELLNQQRPKEGEADLRGFEWDYLRRACHTDRLSFVAFPTASHGGGISTVFSSARVCYSPDGKRLVTSWPNVLRVHDAQTGKELLAIKDHGGAVGPAGFGAGFGESAGMVAYSPDGKYLAAARVAGVQGATLQNPGQFPPSM